MVLAVFNKVWVVANVDVLIKHCVNRAVKFISSQMSWTVGHTFIKMWSTNSVREITFSRAYKG